MAYKGTEAEKQAVARYQKSRDNIMIRPTTEEGAKIRQAAAECREKCASVYLGYFARTYQLNIAPASKR